MRRIVIGTLLIGACGGSAGKPEVKAPTGPVTRHVSAGALDSLPRLTLTDGRLVCLADAGPPCPVSPATANWLKDGRFVTWEMHKPIEIWSANKSDPELLGESGSGESQYDVVLSVASTPTGYIVLNVSRMNVLMYDAMGKYASSLPMPRVSVTRARGYAGMVAFYQLIQEAGPDSAADFEVREIDTPGDTIGHTVLKVKLPWLRIRDGRPTAPLPLFPTLPSYSIAADSDIVWSNSDLFNVERRSAAGVLRWSLTSDAPGPPITAAEVASLRGQLGPDKARLTSFDSSAKHTGKFFPAASGLFVAADGRVLVAGPAVPLRDLIDYVALGNTGEPLGRFSLPTVTHALLYAGDSMLVQRAGANAKQELRWLKLKRP